MLSPHARHKLDVAIAQASKEGYAVFGFIVDGGQTEIQPFGNATEDITDFAHNIEQGASLLKELYMNNKRNEA